MAHQGLWLPSKSVPSVVEVFRFPEYQFLTVEWYVLSKNRKCELGT